MHLKNMDASMQLEFDIIKSISLASKSWKDRVFLTFDIDWAPDHVLNYVIDIVEKKDCAATWFVTHDTPLLDRLRENDKFELGIHPNFNPLLEPSQKHQKYDSVREIVDYLMCLVPEARSVRSHSVVSSSRVTGIFRDFGLTHDSNMFIPADSLMVPLPWLDIIGMLRVPFFWEDDIQVISGKCQDINEVLEKHRHSLKIFDFHPIHVFLNTNSMDQYETSKKYVNDSSSLQKLVSSEFGVFNMLECLLNKKLSVVR